MTADPRLLLRQLTHLHGRATELSARVRHDTHLLFELHNEIATLLAARWEGPTVAPPAPPPTQALRRIIRLVEVRKIVGLAPSTIWKMAADGRFPAPRRLGTRTVGWLSTDVDAWLDSRASSDPRDYPQR